MPRRRGVRRIRTRMQRLIELVEAGYVPDRLVRIGIRNILRGRERSLRRWDTDAFVRELGLGPVARVPAAANTQHYEVPAAFYEAVLGPQLKYSCGWWPEVAMDRPMWPENLVEGIGGAEEAMLRITCDSARIADGQKILELGCGWGSLTLHMAQRFPGCQIVAVSNSASQREHILAEARRCLIDNVEVLTADMNDFDPVPYGHFDGFDRVVSVEMIEHMWSWQTLLERVYSWTRPGAAAFFHHFHHHAHAYPYEDEGDDDWMARHFFTGGIMPSADLVARTMPAGFELEAHDLIDGRHYRWTSEAWLRLLDANRGAAVQALRDAGYPDPARQLRRWRIFFLAVAELFGWRDGEVWGVSHVRLRRID